VALGQLLESQGTGAYFRDGGNGFAVLNGEITDPSGTVIVDARVDFDCCVGQIQIPSLYTGMARTDASGSFHFVNVPIAKNKNYWLWVTAENFEDVRQEVAIVSPAAVTLSIVMHPAVKNSNRDWGLPGTRAWMDLDSDGSMDFCRISASGVFEKSDPSAKYLVCDYSSGSDMNHLYQGRGFVTKIPLSEWPSDIHDWTLNSGWVDFNGDHLLDFCRAIPRKDKGQDGRLACILMQVKEKGFGQSNDPAPVVTTPPNQIIDLGLASGRAWVDFNGDGKTDFCTLILTPQKERKLACWLSEGTKFSDHPIISQDVHWNDNPDLRAWIDVNSDGKTDFCTAAGPNNEFLDCTLSEGTKFGPTIRDLIL
jgi:hypothetical protein